MAGPDPFIQAKSLLGRDPRAALAAAREAHARKPTPETILLLATAARRTGDAAQAVALLKPLAAAASRAWGVQYELGIALAASGDEAAGIAALERAAALNPRATGPRHALRDMKALAGFAIDDAPIASLDDPGLHSAVAAVLDGKESREALLRDYGLDLQDAAGAGLIADVGLKLKRSAAVVSLVQDALTLAPAYRPLRFRLAEALHRAERDEEALAAIMPLAAEPEPMIVRALRGAILMQLGREDSALEDLAAVAEAEPDRAVSWLTYGHALRAVGRRDEAITAYRRALAIEPALAEAWWSIADLKTGSLGHDDLTAMEALSGDTALPPSVRSQAEFAIGRALEDAGDYSRAFAHYRTANALRRSIEPFGEAAHRSFVQRLIETTDEAFFSARVGLGNPDPGPIFVVGMPRSGSTLVEQILASHSGVEGLSELPTITNLARTIPDYPAGLTNLSPESLVRLGSEYLAATQARQRTGARHTIDKFPGNAFHAALVHLILPNARIIDVRRDPRDCCVSLYAQSFAGGQSYSYGLADLGRYYARYVALMDHFDRVLPGRIFRIEYEALVDDFEGETRRLLDFCGLGFEPATLRYFEQGRAVRTASSEQVRQPIYRSSIGRWRRFEPWLEPLLQGLSAREF